MEGIRGYVGRKVGVSDCVRRFVRITASIAVGLPRRARRVVIGSVCSIIVTV